MFFTLFWLFIGCLLGHVISQWLCLKYPKFQFVNKTLIFLFDMKLKTYWTQFKSRCCFRFHQLKNQYYIKKHNHHYNPYQSHLSESLSINTFISNPSSIHYFNDVLNSTFFKDTLKAATKPKDYVSIKDPSINPSTNPSTNQSITPSTNQSITPSTNQSITPSTTKPVTLENTNAFDKENPLIRKTLKRPSYSSIL